MANESKSAAQAKDSAEVAGAKEKIRMLEEKRDRLAAMKEEDHAPGGHDLKGARERNTAQIIEARRHLKEVSERK